MRIAEHVLVDGKCVHCNWTPTAGEALTSRTCIFRDGPPRPKPASVVDDFEALGARLREIRAEEEAALAGTPSPGDPTP